MIDTKPKTSDNVVTTANFSAELAAEFQSVSVEYRRLDGSVIKALDNVDLRIREGELVVFVGQSGCGKTTALNVISGLAKPSLGQITVLGKPPKSALDDMGYMFARDALLPWRTALGNVEFGMEIRGVDEKTRKATARQNLEMVRLGHLMENYPQQLSQGQRQRVALARTWALHPRLLLMDEPFAALDAQTRESLQEEFLRTWEQDKRTIVFVTHDINEAIMLADRIVAFHDGKVVEEFQVTFDRPRDLFEISADPESRAIFNEIRKILAHD
ncbi:ABC transporter ATP-binding protein [Leisingera thetidis]|uniref:ABC transporter ATP-binding protein n=1 Tax=Leisingera thetidis TaxID=2930199 RepID=UPI0021F78BE7|nr:ABC transporter ATP-binding protein [Leisingera thetidis]